MLCMGQHLTPPELNVTSLLSYGGLGLLSPHGLMHRDGQTVTGASTEMGTFQVGLTTLLTYIFLIL
jgi:hypothetical protein